MTKKDYINLLSSVFKMLLSYSVQENYQNSLPTFLLYTLLIVDQARGESVQDCFCAHHSSTLTLLEMQWDGS